MAIAIVMPENTLPLELDTQVGAATRMDEESFRAFYDRTARPVWAYLVRITGDSQLADDLLQETYYRFYRAGSTYESESHRRNSLFRIATNLARDAGRRRRRGIDVPLVEVARAVVDDRSVLMRDARLPGAGLVWWRANMRERREAARAAVRAGSVVQIFLLVAAVLIALGVLGISIDVQAVWRSIVLSAQTFAIPLLALAAWLILAPVAVYFAVTEK